MKLDPSYAFFTVEKWIHPFNLMAIVVIRDNVRFYYYRRHMSVYKQNSVNSNNFKKKLWQWETSQGMVSSFRQNRFRPAILVPVIISESYLRFTAFQQRISTGTLLPDIQP